VSALVSARWLDTQTKAATPIATTQPITQDFPALPQSFFARPAEVVAPELIGCLLVKRQEGGSLLWDSRMLKRLVESSRSNSNKKKRISPGQQQLPFAFDCRLNQIPDEWHQIAVKFRRANGILDGDREPSDW
jgi:hypothetical protein